MGHQNQAGADRARHSLCNANEDTVDITGTIVTVAVLNVSVDFVIIRPFHHRILHHSLLPDRKVVTCVLFGFVGIHPTLIRCSQMSIFKQNIVALIHAQLLKFSDEFLGVHMAIVRNQPGLRQMERFQLPKGFGDVADHKLDALVLVKLFHLSRSHVHNVQSDHFGVQAQGTALVSEPQSGTSACSAKIEDGARFEALQQTLVIRQGNGILHQHCPAPTARSLLLICVDAIMHSHDELLGQHGVPGTFSQVLEVDIGVLLQFAKMRVVVVVIEGWGFASFSILRFGFQHTILRCWICQVQQPILHFEV